MDVDLVAGSPLDTRELAAPNQVAMLDPDREPVVPGSRAAGYPKGDSRLDPCDVDRALCRHADSRYLLSLQAAQGGQGFVELALELRTDDSSILPFSRTPGRRAADLRCRALLQSTPGRPEARRPAAPYSAQHGPVTEAIQLSAPRRPRSDRRHRRLASASQSVEAVTPALRPQPLAPAAPATTIPRRTAIHYRILLNITQ